MLRVYSIPLSLDAYSYKYYEFHFNSNFVAAKLVGFSSSPGISLPFSNSCLGFISSKDDYYTTSQNITAMETTNNVFNEELYEEVRPTTVPTWIVYTTVISELCSVLWLLVVWQVHLPTGSVSSGTTTVVPTTIKYILSLACYYLVDGSGYDGYIWQDGRCACDWWTNSRHVPRFWCHWSPQ